MCNLYFSGYLYTYNPIQTDFKLAIKITRLVLHGFNEELVVIKKINSIRVLFISIYIAK